ncbi:MAG: restriction endonuclease subunit S [Bacteroidales bacterium]|jgi:type I restriction enzyme S subunit|nr:restriction endonuclease subunit S [Bacteroidales bacterium]
MKDNWEKVKLAEVADVNRNTFQTKDFNEILYLDTSSVTKGVFGDFIKLSRNDVIPSRAKRAVKNNTIVYSTVRPNLQHFGILKNPQKNTVISTGFATIDAKDNTNPDFLYYTLTQDKYTNYLHTVAANNVSAYPSINPSDLEKLELELPDLPTQRRIAAVLSALDAKIALNRQINDNLEAMAKTVYEQLTFKNYELKEGKWEQKKLGDVASVSRGKTITKKQTVEGKIPVVAGGMDLAYYHNVANQEAGAITCSGSGANAGFLNFWGVPIWASDCSVIRAKELCVTQEYLWLFLSGKQAEIFRMQKGSAQPHVYPEDLEKISVPIPDPATLQTFQSQVSPLFAQIIANRQQSQELRAIRDFLFQWENQEFIYTLGIPKILCNFAYY